MDVFSKPGDVQAAFQTPAAAQAAYAAAVDAHENIKAQLEHAKADVKRHEPAAAVAQGRDIMEAAADHDAATSKIGYLIDAEEAARVRMHEAWKSVTAAHTFSTWHPRVEKAVSERLQALHEIEQAEKSLAAAEALHAETSRVLLAAFAAGYPKPAWLHQVGETLDLRAAVSQVPQPRFRSVAEEAELWGREQ